MNYYQKSIIEITGASIEDAKQTEELMRCHYGTLNHLSRAQFAREARVCYNTVQWMKTPEGIAYMEELNREIMGE